MDHSQHAQPQEQAPAEDPHAGHTVPMPPAEPQAVDHAAMGPAMDPGSTDQEKTMQDGPHNATEPERPANATHHNPTTPTPQTDHAAADLGPPRNTARHNSVSEFALLT